MLQRWGFKNNDSGSTAIIFSLSLLGLICCAGVATDMGMNNYRLTQFQEVLDNAVVAGASTSIKPELKIAAAKVYFDHNIRALFAEPQKLDVKFTTHGSEILGSAKGTIPTYLLTVVGKEEVLVDVRSTATSGISYEPACFMAMHPTRKHTLELNDSVSVFAPNCNIYGNSNHMNDVVDPHTSANFLTGKFIAAVGGGHHFLENVSPQVEFGTEIVLDPFVSLALPDAGPCLQNNYIVSGEAKFLPPGHYCHGLTIKKNSNVTLEEKGSYFISGGDLTIDSSQLSGKNVTIFLTDTADGISLKNSKFSVSAPKTGDFAGIAVYGARTPTRNLFSESEVNIHGVFYMPMGELIWDNKGSPPATAKWTTYVVDGVSWTGDGKITINFDISDNATDIPFPSQLNVVPRPGSVRLVR